jgi:hypothetical protein
VLHGYRLYESDRGGEGLWLPFRVAELFEQSLPSLPPAALQVRPNGPWEQSNWHVMPAARNPYRAWDRRMTLYTSPGKPCMPTVNVYLDAAGSPVSVEVLQRDPGLTQLADGETVGATQSTRLWVGLD